MAFHTIMFLQDVSADRLGQVLAPHLARIGLRRLCSDLNEYHGGEEALRWICERNGMRWEWKQWDDQTRIRLVGKLQELVDHGVFAVLQTTSFPPSLPAFEKTGGGQQIARSVQSFHPGAHARFAFHLDRRIRVEQERKAWGECNRPPTQEALEPATGPGTRTTSLGPHEAHSVSLVAARTAPAAGSLRQSVTPQEATILFNKAKADPKIPFDYPVDCCYSRAHEMCRQFAMEGVECRKAWNYASPGNSLRANTSKNAVTPDGYVEWRYHVAPLLAVKEQNGDMQDYVIDPSLHDKPVPVDAWTTRMNDKSSIFKVTDSKPYYQSADGSDKVYDPDYSQTNDMLKEHRAIRDGLTSSPPLK